MAALITLLTDFGTSNSYAAQIKGVMASITPDVSVVDLTHAIPVQDVLHAAIVLDDAIDAFANGTVHLAVVDPSVGGSRRAIAIQTDRFFFVGPDNGIFSAVLRREPMRRMVQLTNPRYHRPTVSATFHGRDLFAPVAAYLAGGASLGALGIDIAEPIQIDLPEPRRHEGKVVGHVLLIDHFGNLITNLRSDHVAGAGAIMVSEASIQKIGRTFCDASPGEPIAYLGSTGRLEIAVCAGNAAEHFGVRIGAPVFVE